MTDYTFAMIKAPTLGRGQGYDVLKEITKKGFHIVGLERRSLCDNTIRAFYAPHVDQPYFPDLHRSVADDVVGLILVHPEGNSVQKWREAIGATKSITAAPGTIRHLFGGHHWRGDSTPVADNAVHGSDSKEAAAYEASLVFSPEQWAAIEARLA